MGAKGVVNFSNQEVELAVGDVIQMDRGLCIVEAVGTKTADVLPLDGGGVRQRPNTIPNYLIQSRGGQKALDDFRAKLPQPSKKEKRGFIRLEPGDTLCHGGEVRTVVSVTETNAVIENDAGQRFKEKRAVNEFLFTDCQTNEVRRLDAAQRAAHLKDFLDRRKPPTVGAENETGGEKETENMLKKLEKTLVKSQPNIGGEHKTVGKVLQFGKEKSAERLAWIRKMAASESAEAVAAKAISKYPGTTYGYALKLAANAVARRGAL